MNNVHDMGGIQGFGPVPREENEPVFHQPWEGRLFALSVSGMVPLYTSTDGARYGLELLPPAEYLSTPYYERWLRRMELRLVEKGVLTQKELDKRLEHYLKNPDESVPRREDPSVVEAVLKRARNRPPPPRKSGPPPRFRVGETIRTRNHHPRGHFRLPRYARGRIGVIDRFHGFHDLADALAQDEHRPEALYSVRFKATELWGDSAEGRGSVNIDLWDSYLEPVESEGRTQ